MSDSELAAKGKQAVTSRGRASDEGLCRPTSTPSSSHSTSKSTTFSSSSAFAKALAARLASPDSELVCLAVAQVLLGCNSERRWHRFASGRLGHLFPYLPQQSAYNKRLRNA